MAGLNRATSLLKANVQRALARSGGRGPARGERVLAQGEVCIMRKRFFLCLERSSATINDGTQGLD